MIRLTQGPENTLFLPSIGHPVMRANAKTMIPDYDIEFLKGIAILVDRRLEQLEKKINSSSDPVGFAGDS